MKLARQGPHSKPFINLYGKDVAEVKFKEWEDVVEKSKSSELTTDAIDQVAPPGKDVTRIDLKLVPVSSPNMF